MPLDMNELKNDLGQMQEAEQAKPEQEEVTVVESADNVVLVDDIDEEADTETEADSDTDSAEEVVEETEEIDDEVSDVNPNEFPEEAKAKIATLEKALAKAKAEKNRLLEKVKASDEPGEADKWKKIALDVAIKDAFSEANYDVSEQKKLDRALKHIDYNSITVDANGNFVGIDKEVKKFAEEFPELFTAKKDEDAPIRRTAPKKVDTAGSEAPKPQEVPDWARYHGYTN